MAEKEINNASRVKPVPGSRLARIAKNHLNRIVLTASVVTGMVAMTVYVYYSRSSQGSPVSVISTHTPSRERAPEATTAKPQPASDRPVLRSDLIDRAMRTNFTTPENAVRSLIKLFEQRAGHELKAYLALGVVEDLDSSYLNCLGNPIEIIEVIQEEGTAQVTFLAAVHTEFTLHNTIWQPGDALTLAARFLRINDLWKCSAINSTSCEGDTDDAEQNSL